MSLPPCLAKYNLIAKKTKALSQKDPVMAYYCVFVLITFLLLYYSFASVYLLMLFFSFLFFCSQDVPSLCLL